MTAPFVIVMYSISSYERGHETWMRCSVVFFLIGCKEHFQRNDMYIIIGFANLPKAVPAVWKIDISKIITYALQLQGFSLSIICFFCMGCIDLCRVL